MSEMKLKVLNKSFITVASSRESTNLAVLTYFSSYNEGDVISLEVSEAPCYCEVQFDDALRPAVILVSEKSIYFEIPFDEKRKALTPKAFSGNCHVITARFLYESELEIRRNLALNPYDGFVKRGVFPHTETNTDLQIDETFAPRNAVDGVWANLSHGKFPYQSWGINKRDDAEWKLLFGRDVYMDEFRITLRADFPHDNYWSTIEIEFSDGTCERRNLEKTIEPQRFMIEKKRISWLTLKNLKLSDSHSPFPALTQFEAWGTLIDEKRV